MNPATRGGPELSHGWRVGILVSILFACIVPVLQFSLLFPLTSEMPTWDQWSEVEVWAAHFQHRPVLPLLLRPYNGHLNILPRMLFFALGLVTHWNVRVEVIASYVVCAGTLGILLLMLRDSGPRMLVLAAPVAFSVFSLAQYENFLSGYPLGQNLSVFASLLSIFLLTRRDPRENRFGIAIAAALAASLCWGGAASIWVVGLLAVATDPTRRRARAGVWICVAAVSLILAKNAASSGGVSVAWRRLVPFFLVIVGRPYSLAVSPPLRAAAALGICVSLLFFGLLAHGIRGASEDLGRVRRWGLIGLLALGSAALIAMGRSYSGLHQALASHYVTSTSLLGTATLVLLFGRLVESGKTAARFGKAFSSAAVLVAILSTTQTVVASWRWLPVLRGWSYTLRRDVEAFADGTATDEQIREAIYPNPAAARDALEWVKQYRLGPFRHSSAPLSPIGSVDRIAGQPPSSTEVIRVPEGAWEVLGWAANSRVAGGLVHRVELALDGRVIGTAELGLTRPDVALAFNSEDFRRTGWRVQVAGPVIPDSGTHRLSVAIHGAGGQVKRIDAGTIALGKSKGIP